MTVLAIAPAFNRPGVNPRTGKPYKDASGAFIPEARRFVEIHGGAFETFDSLANEPARYAATREILRRHAGKGYACVGLFMHGFRNGVQCGFRPWNIAAAARALRDVLAPGAPIALYACDAARDADAERKDDTAEGPGGAGGFASRLVRAVGAGHVDAHATAAHTTRNPYLRRFLSDDDTDHGMWIVDPSQEPALFKKWAAKLQRDDVFRLSFPMMSADAIRAAL